MRWSDTRWSTPDASFTATNTWGKAWTMRTSVEGWMSVTVRPGTLYRTIGSGEVGASAAKCWKIPSCDGRL